MLPRVHPKGEKTHLCSGEVNPSPNSESKIRDESHNNEANAACAKSFVKTRRFTIYRSHQLERRKPRPLE